MNEILLAFKEFPHCLAALKYSIRVTTGKRSACIQEIQSCQRFIDDLNHHKKYVFDPKKAERVCRFVEMMPHTKGRWAAKGLKLKLEHWQLFIVVNLFGWINEKTGLRRFRRAYLKIPRKNGKSILAAAIGNYMFSHDHEFGAEVYCGAKTEKQAWEVFKPARLMTIKSEEYIKAKGIEVNAKSLVITENESKFEPLIGKPGDGSSPSCALVDEYHEHDTDIFVDTMLTGMGAREQPLLLIITTAGNDISSPCFDEENECKKVLDKIYDDDRLFIMIFGIDESDDWTKRSVLEKSNPNIDVSIPREFLIEQQNDAKRKASKQNTFKRKHLNCWVGANIAWMNMELFNKCVEKDLNINDFIGSDCIITVDLASKIDIVATPVIFYKIIDTRIHYYYFSKFYLPEETILESGNDHYQRFHNDGQLIAADGAEITLSVIEEDIKNDMSEYNVKEVVYDPWRATQLAQGLEKEGANIIEFRNTVQNMSPAMFELEAAISSGRFHCDDNAVFSWMMSNVVAKVDAKDNIYPNKDKKGNKIDGVVAAIMGIGRIMNLTQDNTCDINDFIFNSISG